MEESECGCPTDGEFIYHRKECRDGARKSRIAQLEQENARLRAVVEAARACIAEDHYRFEWQQAGRDLIAAVDALEAAEEAGDGTNISDKR